MLAVYKVYSRTVSPSFKKALKANGFQYLESIPVPFANGVNYIKIINNTIDDKAVLDKLLYTHYGYLNFEFANFIKA